jgi:hypothetical protein
MMMSPRGDLFIPSKLVTSRNGKMLINTSGPFRGSLAIWQYLPRQKLNRNAMRKHLEQYSRYQVFLNYPFDADFAPLEDALHFPIVAANLLR